jgi:transcriptional regulator with XRE-family HTH domain
MILNTNLKLLRKEKRLTQETMSTGIGISRSKLAGYELNVNPPLETLVKISDYLNVSVDILLRENLTSYSEYKLRELLETDQFLRGRKLRILATTVDDRSSLSEGKSELSGRFFRSGIYCRAS